MLVRKANLGWEVHAPAKLNLFLEVLAKRDDGFHELETLMVPIGLYDSLFFEPTQDSNVEFECVAASGEPGGVADAPTSYDNLVVRAVELVRRRRGVATGARLRLIKRIPAAAGLGGGSSDAAAALRLADAGWRLSLSPEELSSMATELGSDVPFFLKQGAAVCRGRGERVETVAGLGRLHFVVAKPREGLSTASVFANHRPDRSPRRSSRPLIDALRRGDFSSVGGSLFNRLERTAMSMAPTLADMAGRFARLGAVGWRMSGSGTACFGICQNARQARRAAAWLRGQGVRAWATSSRG